VVLSTSLTNRSLTNPVFSQEVLCEATLKVKHVIASSKNRSVSSVYAMNVGSDGDFKQSATVAAQIVTCVCPLCSGSHDLDDCSEYLNKSVEDRHQVLLSKRLCFACYGKSSKNHKARSCRKCRKCEQCGKPHPQDYMVTDLCLSCQRLNQIQMLVVQIMMKHCLKCVRMLQTLMVIVLL